MDRPLDDGFDATCGGAGVIDASLALVGLGLGVSDGPGLELTQASGLDARGDQIGLHAVEPPCLDPGQSEGQREGGEYVARHSPTPLRMA